MQPSGMLNSSRLTNRVRYQEQVQQLDDRRRDVMIRRHVNRLKELGDADETLNPLATFSRRNRDKTRNNHHRKRLERQHGSRLNQLITQRSEVQILSPNSGR